VDTRHSDVVEVDNVDHGILVEDIQDVDNIDLGKDSAVADIGMVDEHYNMDPFLLVGNSV
jgi:hypothetical protein